MTTKFCGRGALYFSDMKIYIILKFIPYFVIVILLAIILVFLTSCEKEREPIKVDVKCWTCTEAENNKIVKTWQVCDVLDAARINGLRWITNAWQGNIVSPTVHTINCK